LRWAPITTTMHVRSALVVAVLMVGLALVASAVIAAPLAEDAALLQVRAGDGESAAVTSVRVHRRRHTDADDDAADATDNDDTAVGADADDVQDDGADDADTNSHSDRHRTSPHATHHSTPTFTPPAAAEAMRFLAVGEGDSAGAGAAVKAQAQSHSQAQAQAQAKAQAQAQSQAQAQAQMQAQAQAEARPASVRIKDPDMSFFKQHMESRVWAFALIVSSCVITGCIAGWLIQRFCKNTTKAAGGEYGKAYQPVGDNL